MGNSQGKHKEITADAFTFNKILGRGAFATVCLIQHKSTKAKYAIKCINKIKCVRKGALENLMNERFVLEREEHPFIVNMRFAFQDFFHVYMVLDYVEGGCLKTILYASGGVNEDSIRFWAAQLMLAMHHLHKQNIMHRDIKPDNILIDRKGYVYLSDFNVANYFWEDDSVIQNEKAGTPCYMAPEVLLERPHYYQVDFWSLGVMLFELFYGNRPFEGTSMAELESKILNAELKFPKVRPYTDEEVSPSPELLNILTKMMEKNPKKRFGTKDTGFKKDPWFKSVDWDLLLKKELASPYLQDPKFVPFGTKLKTAEDKRDKDYDKKELENMRLALEVARTNPEREYSSPLTLEDQALMYIEENWSVFDGTVYDKYSGSKETPTWVKDLDKANKPPAEAPETSTPIEHFSFGKHEKLRIQKEQIAKGFFYVDSTQQPLREPKDARILVPKALHANALSRSHLQISTAQLSVGGFQTPLSASINNLAMSSLALERRSSLALDSHRRSSTALASTNRLNAESFASNLNLASPHARSATSPLPTSRRGSLFDNLSPSTAIDSDNFLMPPSPARTRQASVDIPMPITPLKLNVRRHSSNILLDSIPASPTTAVDETNSPTFQLHPPVNSALPAK